jgi:hypothetical protein
LVTGANPNLQDARDGSTAAILAAFGSKRDTLQFLLAHPGRACDKPLKTSINNP